jgi:ADP-ribose pyrophosphatase YjhB (NUDIX family)
MSKDLPFTKQEFDAIYSKVPRLTVEVLLIDKTKGTYMTLRDIEPCKGQWHLPGGTVFFGESLENAVNRIAKREIGIEVLASSLVGYIEYPSHYQKQIDHPVGLVFKVDKFSGQLITNNEASKGKWFLKLPNPTHADQDVFLVKHKYLKP